MGVAMGVAGLKVGGAMGVAAEKAGVVKVAAGVVKGVVVVTLKGVAATGTIPGAAGAGMADRIKNRVFPRLTGTKGLKFFRDC